MKHLLVIFSLFMYGYTSAQSVSDTSIVNHSPITYAKNIPAEGSYKIVKNETGSEVRKEVLEMINFYRKRHENYLWKVNAKLEILIYKM